MRIGVPKEIKDNENRVALTPQGTVQLVTSGHTILVEHGAGVGAGFSDAAYARAGAMLTDAQGAWDTDLVVKVKEPLADEYGWLKGQMLFTYLHLAGVEPQLARRLLETGTTAIAYETVTDAAGKLPLLAPMSAIAGNMAIAMGVYYLARTNGGKGVQPGYVLGRRHGRVVIIGDGVVGRHAAATAAGMGARVTVVGRHPERLEMLRREGAVELSYHLSTQGNIATLLGETDLLVGAVLRVGGRAPYVVSEKMVQGMEAGSVIIDVAIDQGGCVATSQPTSHSRPVFMRHEVVHYCVTNMPGAYPRTATVALTAATFPYILRLADGGVAAALADSNFARGINIEGGCIRQGPVADALGMEDNFRPLFS